MKFALVEILFFTSLVYFASAEAAESKEKKTHLSFAEYVRDNIKILSKFKSESEKIAFQDPVPKTPSSSENAANSTAQMQNPQDANNSNRSPASAGSGSSSSFDPSAPYDPNSSSNSNSNASSSPNQGPAQ